MQTTSATSTGHTDLLSGILKVQVRNEEKITEQDRIYCQNQQDKVQVRNEEKITEQDRIYCQNQQDELYKTLDQIAWWYNIFKREAEKYEGKIKLKHEPNGSRTVRLPQAAMTSTIATIMMRRIIPITSLLLSRTSMSWWIAVIVLSGTSSTASSVTSTTPIMYPLKFQRLMRKLSR